MAGVVAELHYAPRGRTIRRRWIRRGVLCLLAIAVAASAIAYGPWCWSYATRLYWYRQCADYRAPAGQLVCTEPLPYGGVTPPFRYAASDPKPLSKQPAWLRPVPALTFGPPSPVGPVLFMGERRTPSGLSRLVIIRRIPPGQRWSWDAPIPFSVDLVDKASLIDNPTIQSRIHWEVLPSLFAEGFEDHKHTFQFFAGQIDSNDPARFRIDVDVNGERQQIEGRLTDGIGNDGPTVTLGLQP